MFQKEQSLIREQRGIVSIVLTLFVLIVLSLIVLGFSQSTRREQRQTLDRQLSTQAFYAAESGINDMITCIRTTPTPGHCANPDESDCQDTPHSDIGDSGNFSYSCVLYDKEPPTIEYSSIGEQEAEFVSLRTSGNNLNNVTIKWNKSDGSNDFSGCTSAGGVNDFPSAPDYSSTSGTCNAGMLRLLFMPVPNGSFSRDQLYNDSYSVFLRPSSNGSGQTTFASHSAGADTQGQVIPAQCTDRCQVTIFGIPSGGAVFLQLRSIYMNNAVTIEGKDAAGNAVSFNQAQVKIDSTGKASDVLRRLQVRMPLYESYETSPFVLNAMEGVCKRLATYPQRANPGDAGYVAPYANNDQCGGIN